MAHILIVTIFEVEFSKASEGQVGETTQEGTFQVTLHIVEVQAAD